MRLGSLNRAPWGGSPIEALRSLPGWRRPSTAAAPTHAGQRGLAWHRGIGKRPGIGLAAGRALAGGGARGESGWLGREEAARGGVAAQSSTTCVFAADAFASEEPRPQSDWKKWARRAAIWIGGPLLALAVFIAALPTLLASYVGTLALKSFVSWKIPGTMEVRDIQLGWTRPMLIEDLCIRQKNGQPLVEVERISTAESLWKIATGGDFNLVVTNPKVDSSPDLESGDLQLLNFAVDAGWMKAAPPGEDAGKPGAAAFKPSKIGFTVEAHKGPATFTLSGGQLLASEELRRGIGDNVHCVLLQGKEQVDAIGKELKLDTSWLEGYAAKRQPRSALPMIARIGAKHMEVMATGWQLKSGIRLAAPATARMEFTPPLARFGLSNINPLLNGMVGLGGGSKVHVAVSSIDMMLPSDEVNIRMEPLKVVIQPGPMIDSILTLLNVKGSGARPGSPVQASMTAIDCVVKPGLSATVSPFDMTLGPPGRGIKIRMWGTNRMDNGKLDFVLGLPAETLGRVGVRNLDPDYVLELPMTGTKESPQVDWLSASKSIMQLTARQLFSGMF
eukprot:evm.model.scf_1228.1 EVM.evm.TU.scf_1228.1   scf_1228:5381-12769(+)